MNDLIKRLPSGDFKVIGTDEGRAWVRQRALERLRFARYDAAQAGKHSVVLALDAEIAELLKQTDR